MRKYAVAFVVIVLVAFLLILSFTGLLGEYFGPKAEMIGLIAVAAVLLILLILNNRDKGDEDDYHQDVE